MVNNPESPIHEYPSSSAVRHRYQQDLDQLDEQIEQLGLVVTDAVGQSITVLERCDVRGAQVLIEGDSKIDAARHEIDGRAFLLLATQQPTAGDLRLVIASTSVSNELERIADYCAGIARLTLALAAEPPSEPHPTIRRMSAITRELLGRAMIAFRSRNEKAAAIVWARDDEVDHLYGAFFTEQIGVMAEHRKHVRRGTYLLAVAHNIERMADRVTNIAEAVAFLVTGDVASWRQQIEAGTIPNGIRG